MGELDGRKREPAMDENLRERASSRPDAGAEESLPRESRGATAEGATAEDETDEGASESSRDRERRPTGEDVDSGNE